MRITAGTKAKRIILPSIKGADFDTDSLKGKSYMLSFFRFANCPFCNLRVHALVSRFDEFGEDFTIVAVFDSPLDHLTKHAKGHNAPFPILADQANKFYKEYHVERSFWGMLKGMIMRFPTLIKGMLKGHFPFPPKGNMLTMPADFLVDRNGIIQEAYYAKDEGDHLDMDVVLAFSKK